MVKPGELSTAEAAARPYGGFGVAVDRAPEFAAHDAETKRIVAALEEGEELERQAVALMRQYGFFLPSPAKEFFRKLAVYLCWKNLERVL